MEETPSTEYSAKGFCAVRGAGYGSHVDLQREPLCVFLLHFPTSSSAVGAMLEDVLESFLIFSFEDTLSFLNHELFSRDQKKELLQLLYVPYVRYKLHRAVSVVPGVFSPTRWVNTKQKCCQRTATTYLCV